MSGKKGILEQQSFVRCECGTEIPFVLNLEEMGRRIETHAVQHKNGASNWAKAEAIFSHTEDVLLMQVLKKVSEQTNKNCNKFCFK